MPTWSDVYRPRIGVRRPKRPYHARYPFFGRGIAIVGSRGRQSDNGQRASHDSPDLRVSMLTPCLIAALNCYRTVVLGKDTIGSYYISQSIALAGDLVRLVRKSRKQGKPGYSGEEFERSYSSALWGAFMVQTYGHLDVCWATANSPEGIRSSLDETAYSTTPLDSTSLQGTTTSRRVSMASLSQ